MSLPSSADSPAPSAPAHLFALGHAGLPPTVATGGRTYRLQRCFKHDFFAATGLYATESAAGPETLAVLKIQRTQSMYGLPLRWLGRLIAWHEIRIYRNLADVPGVPAFLGEVGETGFLHAFIPGAELGPEQPLSPAFFDQLATLFRDLHSRRIAYVDSNKRENILVGTDGRPYLIDFQISWCSWFPGVLRYLDAPLLHYLKRADWYHFYKHKTRLVPHLCTPEELARGQRQSWFIRVHRIFARPIIDARRRYLARFGIQTGGASGETGASDRRAASEPTT